MRTVKSKPLSKRQTESYPMKKLTEDEISIMTPMLQQYYRLKNTRLDAVLFFRMGDFYEVFGEDAALVAPKLNIVLTSRERGDKNKISFCGVPHHSARAYWMKLLAMNYKVAIADQVEEASQAKGLVKREIIKVLTPACIDELDGMDLNSANYLMAAYEDPKSKLWSVVICDVSTGELRLGELKSKEQVFQALENYNPKELLIRKFCHKSFSEKLEKSEKFSKLLLGSLSEGILNDPHQQEKLYKKVFSESSLSQHPCGKVTGGLELVSSILFYFEELHFKINHFRTIKPLFESDTVSLDGSVVRDLELLETVRGRRKQGSLFHAINHTLTPMGSRSLKRSLVHLFVNKKKILARQEQVENFIHLGQESIFSLRSFIKSCGDLERLTTRIASSAIRPQELAKVKESLKNIGQVHKELKTLSQKNKLTKSFADFDNGLKRHFEVMNLLEQSLEDQPSALGTDFTVFCPTFDSKLDKLLDYVKRGQEKIDAYQNKLRQETSINNLKIKSHKTYGLLIEVTKSNLKKIPKSFIRRQTMVNCDRFVTEDLKDLDETLCGAKEQAVLREAELFSDLMSRLQKKHELLMKLSQCLAELDLVLSFSWLALKENYCKPDITTHEELKLIKARHPVIEHFVGASNFVANDIVMDPHSKVLLITGPNMAGKSTAMRQTALCAVLAQMGSFVPCEKAKLPIFDTIFTRVGASDDLSQGLSTFMVEMKEASHILRHASEKSLVILDEVGRGTSTEDGLALAHAILNFIATKIKSWTLFATHYHELVAPAKKYSNVKLIHTKVDQTSGKINFTHKLTPGSSGNSYGLEVAKIAGIPGEVINFAQTLIKPKNNKATLIRLNQENSCDKKVEIDQKLDKNLDLKSQELFHRLGKVNINRTTPLQALNILNDLVVIHQKNPTESLFHDGQIFF